MDRRGMLASMAALAVCPIAAHAQKSGMPVVGYLSAGSSHDDTGPTEAFVRGLREVGYDDGRNVRVEYRWAEDRYDRLPALAAELVGAQVTVIAALGTPAARAAKAATTTIPTVFTSISDPVQIGFVQSLSRPGGNITGVTLQSVEVGPKLLEIIRGVTTSATRIALLVNPTNPNSVAQTKNTQDAGRALGIDIVVLHASAEGDFDAAFARLREEKASALIIGQDLFFNSKTKQLAAMALRYSIPAIYPQPDFAAAGGLMSYGSSRTDAWRQAGVYAGRIVKGEKPADLPVLQPTKFELSINLNTAKSLGLVVPTSLIASADSLIE